MAYLKIHRWKYFSAGGSSCRTLAYAELSGYACAYYPATPGSSPKHNIYAFIICAIFVI